MQNTIKVHNINNNLTEEFLVVKNRFPVSFIADYFNLKYVQLEDDTILCGVNGYITLEFNFGDTIKIKGPVRDPDPIQTVIRSQITIIEKINNLELSVNRLNESTLSKTCCTIS